MNYDHCNNSSPSVPPLTLDQLLSAGYSLEESAKRLDRSEKRRRQENRELANKKAETLRQLLNERRVSAPTIVSVSSKDDPSIKWKRSRSVTTFSRPELNNEKAMSSALGSWHNRKTTSIDSHKPHPQSNTAKGSDSSSLARSLPAKPIVKPKAPSNMGARCA